MGRLGIDPDQSGLVAGYNMVPRADGTIEDLSGNGNYGTINGPALEYTEIGPSMRFDGVDDFIEIASDSSMNITDDMTLSCFARVLAGEQGALISKWNVTGDQRSFGLAIDGSGKLRLFISTDGTAATFESENSDAAVDDGLLHYLTAVYTKSDNTVRFYIDCCFDSAKVYSTATGIFNGSSTVRLGDESGGGIGGFLEGTLALPKIITQALNQDQITAEYQAAAKAVNWKSDYGVAESVAAEAAPGELSNSPVRKISGTHKIATDTIDGQANCKVIEGVTAGVLEIPTAYFHGNDTQAAYGTNEFYFNKADATVMTIGFVSDIAAVDTSAVGYQIIFDTDESIEIRRVTGAGEVSLMKTAAAFFTAGSWHKLKLQRTAIGELTVYLDGVLLDVSGGSGTNPVTDNTVTESTKWVLGLGVADKISYSDPGGGHAITKYQGVV